MRRPVMMSAKENANLSQSHLLADEVDVDLDMLGTTMMDGVGSHIDNADIVAVYNRRQGNRDMQLLEELSQLAALGHHMGLQRGTPPQH
jgi:hypothetical protein